MWTSGVSPVLTHCHVYQQTHEIPRIIPYFQQTIQLRFKTLSQAPVQLTLSDGRISHWTNCCWLASYSARKIHTIYSSIAWLLLYGYSRYIDGHKMVIYWPVGGFKHVFSISYIYIYTRDVILPIDELIFFKMVKTTNQLHSTIDTDKPIWCPILQKSPTSGATSWDFGPTSPRSGLVVDWIGHTDCGDLIGFLWDIWWLPSGKLTVHHGKSAFITGKSTISMVHGFHSELLASWRVTFS